MSEIEGGYSTPRATVVVPTHNRLDALGVTVDHLLVSAAHARAEVLVVDDGSAPALYLPDREGLRLFRTSGVERSNARNQGACLARGHIVIFVDDDITVGPGFVEDHIKAFEEFGDMIGVGRISLPLESAGTPFGRFRRTIEEPGQMRPRGVVAEGNFCTAANMSMRRTSFLSLGGFDPAILSGEDQDIALRFTHIGGRIVYLPEAGVIHRDSVGDIASYGRRHEWGARAMAPFLRRYPDRPENQERIRVGASLMPTGSARQSVGILGRRALSSAGSLALLRSLIGVTERAGANERWLFFLYRGLLGLHLFRGFRAGLAQTVNPPSFPAPLKAEP